MKKLEIEDTQVLDIRNYLERLTCFAVPSKSTGKRKHRSMTPIQVAIKKFTLSQECLDGKLELGLPWDPLAISATAMETCQRNVQRLSVLSVQEEQGETLGPHRALFHSAETFHKTSLRGEVWHIRSKFA